MVKQDVAEPKTCVRLCETETMELMKWQNRSSISTSLEDKVSKLFTEIQGN